MDKNIDIDETVDRYNYRLWELYKSECSQAGVKPSVKDYLIWLEENY